MDCSPRGGAGAAIPMPRAPRSSSPRASLRSPSERLAVGGTRSDGGLSACSARSSAGFYYKTSWVRGGSWMSTSPISAARRVWAGAHPPDPDRYETRHAFADVVVIGAGPAGLGAAAPAARTGVRVMLVEQDLARWKPAQRQRAVDSPLEPWRARTRGRAACPAESFDRSAAPPRSACTMTTRSRFSIRRDHRQPDPSRRRGAEVIVTRARTAIVYASGAAERPLVFANNDRPGVMLCSAVRAYLNRYAVAAGRRAVVATNNDSAYATAVDLAAAGSGRGAR